METLRISNKIISHQKAAKQIEENESNRSPKGPQITSHYSPRSPPQADAGAKRIRWRLEIDQTGLGEAK